MRTYSTVSTSDLRLVVVITCLLALIVGCGDNSVSPDYDPIDVDGKFTDVTERSFEVDAAPMLTVSNFVGKVTYRTGEAGIIRVRATKRAPHGSDLDSIELEMALYQNNLEIRTDAPDELKNASVDLEITAPPGSQPVISTGVGGIDYQGRPKGVCRFTTGVGSITLRLPGDVGIMVELNTGVGSIVLGFPVEGSVRLDYVKGRIGSGVEGDVHAATGVGNIYLMRQ